jgi:hypothetical protein
MMADGLTVDDRSKCAAEVANKIAYVTLFDHEMVARYAEGNGIIELEVWLPSRQALSSNRPPANEERSLAEHTPSAQLTLQPCSLRSEIGAIAQRSGCVSGCVTLPIGPTNYLLTADDTIVRLAQPLTQAPNKLPCGLRRVGDFVEKFGLSEEFDLDFTGSSSGRTARPVLYDAHFAEKLSGANFAQQDGMAIEFSDYVDGATEQAKDTARRISFSDEDFAFGENRALHPRPFNLTTGTAPAAPPLGGSA